MHEAGLTPRAEHYNVLLSGLVRLGAHERAHMALQAMLRAGVRPTLYTLNALLDAAVRRGDAARAYSLLAAMENRHAPMDSQVRSHPSGSTSLRSPDPSSARLHVDESGRLLVQYCGAAAHASARGRSGRSTRGAAGPGDRARAGHARTLSCRDGRLRPPGRRGARHCHRRTHGRCR
jgi:pentatricopeptide repeat protein